MNLAIVKIIALCTLFISAVGIIYVVKPKGRNKSKSKECVLGVLSLLLGIVSVVGLVFEGPEEPTISILEREDHVAYRVLITSSSDNSIYYNINRETLPSVGDEKYKKPFYVIEGDTVRAVAIDRLGFRSKESTETIEFSHSMMPEQRWEKSMKTAQWLCEIGDYSNAAEIYQSEAGRGDAIAMNNMGYLYAEGKIVEEHEERINKAQKCYGAAIELGEKIATHNFISLRIAEAKTTAEVLSALEDGAKVYNDKNCKMFLIVAMEKAANDNGLQFEDKEEYLNVFFELPEDEKIAVIDNVRKVVDEDGEIKKFKVIPSDTIYRKYDFAGMEYIFEEDGSFYPEYKVKEFIYNFENQEYLEPVFIYL